MSRFKTITWYFKSNWWRYLLAIAATIIAVILGALQPRIISQATDLIGLGNITNESLQILIVSLAIIVILRFSIEIFKRIFIGSIFHKLYYEIKIRFMRNVLFQDATFFSKYHSGDLMTRATSDTYMMSNVSSHLIFGMVELFLTIGTSAVFMILIDFKMMLYAILPLPFIFIVVVLVRPHISNNWRLLRKKNSDLSNKAMESVQHVKLIRAFVNEKYDYNRLSDVALDCFKIERKSIYLQSIFGPTFRLFTIISQLIALGYGSYCVMNKIITPGQLIEFNLHLARFSFPMLQLGNQIAMFSQSNIAFARINEILDAEPAIKDQEDAIEITDFDQIVFNGIEFSYPNSDLAILKGLDLTIKKGQTLGIVGRTGSGKTTLIRQFLRQYPVDNNQITIDGIDINQLKVQSVRKLVAYVPQEHILFSRTVNNNLLIGEPVEMEETLRVEKRKKAIKMADFEKDLAYLNDGLETMVGEYGVTLSGGQKQRLSIARALLKDAPILILDDSLSAVDGTTEANIITNLKTIRQHKTNIIVAHRLSAVEHADEIIVVENGRIIERGTHQQLMALGGWYKIQSDIQLMEDHHE